MKKLALLFSISLASLISFSGDLYIFSKDGVHLGSGPRTLPSQGVNQVTGKVVIGLEAQSDEVRGQCGWYKVLPYEGELTSNQTYRVTNYVFSAGLATPLVKITTRIPKTYNRYSKQALYTACCKLGSWSLVEEYLKNTNTPDGVNLYNAWLFSQYFSDEVEDFRNALNQIKAFLMLDDETFQAILNDCKEESITKYYDENGVEIPTRARGLSK